MHRPRKRFGQNFLIDPPTIESLINAIAPASSDHMLEIGPGMAALTRPLLKIVPTLEVLELDRDLIAQLSELQITYPGLTIHQGDALKFDFTRCKQARRVVGNLPYNISTPLIFHLIEQATHIKDMHFMLQNEVVNRLCAKVGDRDYSRLTIMVQSRCTTLKLIEIPPEKFSPPPKVLSAFVRITPLAEPLVSDELSNSFTKVVRTAFSQPRKTIANNLKNLFKMNELEQFKIDPKARPQYIDIGKFIKLAEYHNE